MRKTGEKERKRGAGEIPFLKIPGNGVSPSLLLISPSPVRTFQ